jgi:transposase
MPSEHLRAFDKRLDELLQQHPDAPIFTSFPGIGPVVAATLISEIGDDRTRFPLSDALLAEARQYRALRGLGGRWTRVMWRRWTDHSCYDPTRLPRPELLTA